MDLHYLIRWFALGVLFVTPLFHSRADQADENKEESEYFRLMGEAEKAIDEGNYRVAVDYLNDAMDCEPFNPSNVLLLSNLGMLYDWLDEDSLAIEAYDKALAIAPSMVTVYENRGLLRLKINDTQAAFDDFSTVIERDSSNVTSRYYHGIMSLYGGDNVTAETDLQNVARLQPDGDMAVSGLAALYSMTGRDREAIPYFKKLIEREPAPEYYAALAGCYLALDELPDASATIADGMALYPDDPELYYYRAWLNRERYQFDEARSDAERAKKLGANPRKVDALFQKKK